MQDRHTDEALLWLGVRDDTLTEAEKQQLDTQGYLYLRGLLTREQIEALQRRIAQRLAEEGENAGKEVHQETGTDRLSNLVNKGAVFHLVLNQPRFLAAIAHVLQNDLKLSAFNYRDARPGKDLQGLHTDWGVLDTPGCYQVCNSLWLLDALTPDNGATRLVPGTHRTPTSPSEAMPDPTATHPDEILALGNAGDVIIMNSHVWHGGTRNRTEGTRRVIHGYFCRRHHPPQTDWQKYLTRETSTTTR